MRALVWLMVAAGVAGCARSGPRIDEEAARRERERLHRRLDELLPRDPIVARALGRPGDIQVAIGSDLAAAIVREVARRYLDRVELDLTLEKRVHETGTLDVGTPFGKMEAGEWQADVIVHRVRGVLAARQPELGVAGVNELRVALPVTVQEANGSATVRFRWDSKKLANIVCRDFEVRRTIQGRLLAEEYTLDGIVRLAAGKQSVRAEPVFPNRTFRLKVDLLPESWSEVRAAVAEQDKLLRCGLGIDPETILPRLSQLLRKGFELRLPLSVFRAVDLPGSVGGGVILAGREVQLMLATEALEVSPEAVWYSASVSSRPGSEASPTP